MAIIQRLFCILAVVILWSAAVRAADLTRQQMYAGASPGVVMVMGHSSGGERGSAGTGSIIRGDGLVLTNAHVVVEERTSKPYPRLFVYLKPDRVTGDPTTEAKGAARQATGKARSKAGDVEQNVDEKLKDTGA